MTDEERSFGNWLAGFIDGEGCFGLYQRKGSSGWVVRFFVKLRDDDADILYECQSRLGIGTVRKCADATNTWGGQTMWTISGLQDSLRLIEVLDTCPMRAKKAKDYQLWRRAVILRANVVNTRSSGTGNDATAAANAPIWAELSQIKEQLTALRKYENYASN